MSDAELNKARLYSFNPCNSCTKKENSLILQFLII